MYRVITLSLAAIVLLCSNSFAEKATRIALITEFSTGSHARQYINGVKQEANSLGFQLEIFDARNKRQRMAKMFNNAIIKKVDGIILSHGEPSAIKKEVERAIRQNIKIVAFDCEIPLPSVVKIDQDDRRIAELGLKHIIDDTNGKAKLVHIWVPGFAPMEKRMEIFKKIMGQYPEIVEVARFGEATNNTALSTQVSMKKLLEAHPQGSIDVVWATWDEFAKGASRAIKEAKRHEIRLYGIDISDEDLAMIQDKDSPWIATVGVPPANIGKIQVRILAHLIAKKPVPERYSLRPVLITRDMLPSDQKVTMGTLSQFVPEFGETKEFLEPWMNRKK